MSPPPPPPLTSIFPSHSPFLEEHEVVHIGSNEKLKHPHDDYHTPPFSPEDITDSENESSSESLTLSQFDQLVEDIREILGPSSGINSDDVDVDHLMERLRQYQADANEQEWSKYALSDPSRHYTRNGVDDINHKANLLILVWNPSKGSMIHDHANAHCIVKLLKGRLVETLYDWPNHEEEQLVPSRVTEIRPNQVTYMSDTLGLHRMSNPDPTEVAVSLHLYTPPYAAKFGCHIFDETSGKSHKVDLSTLYSNKGVRCTPHGGCC